MARKSLSLFCAACMLAVTVPGMAASQYHPEVAAHRGASGYMPEHTLEAKSLAYAMGVYHSDSINASNKTRTNEPEIDAMIEEGNVAFRSVYFMVGGFALTVLIGTGAQKLLNNCVNSLCYKLVRDLRRDAFDSLTAAGVKYVDTHAQGDVMTRIVNDVDIISDGLLQGVAQLFTGVTTILGTLVVMFVINYIIALVVVLLTPLSLFR